MSDDEPDELEASPGFRRAEPDATELAAARTQLADHRTALASERTLFAVLRTGFAIAAGGTVIIEVLGHQWPRWVKAPLAGALVIVGYWLIMAGVERYGVVARQVEATSQGAVKVLSTPVDEDSRDRAPGRARRRDRRVPTRLVRRRGRNPDGAVPSRERRFWG